MPVAAVVAALLCCTAVGCADGDLAHRNRVEGQVRIDGSPLEKGLIVFIPVAPTEGPKSSGIIDRGRYVIEKAKGPYCGEFLVTIETVPREIEAIAARGPHLRCGRAAQAERPVVAPQFNRESEIRVPVEASGENCFDFEVCSIKGRQARR